jgi:hypothetical protein
MGAFTKHEMHEMSEETKVFYLDIPSDEVLFYSQALHTAARNEPVSDKKQGKEYIHKKSYNHISHSHCKKYGEILPAPVFVPIHIPLSQDLQTSSSDRAASHDGPIG